MPTTVTKTVKSSGGDYTSLSGWEAGEQADLVLADQIKQAECYNFSDTTPVTIDGWTTDATRYIRIYTPSAERHDGKPGTGYRLQTNGFSRALQIVESFVRVEGISFTAGSNPQECVGLGNSTDTKDIRIGYCVAFVSSNFEILDLDGGANTTVRVWNCIFHHTGASPSDGLLVVSGTAYLYNVTQVANASNYGFGGLFRRTGGTAICKNCLSDAADATNCSAYLGTFDAASTDNLATDTTAPGSNPENSATPSFVSKAGDDFHLASGDTAAKDKGADLSGDANLAFSDDIDGNTRSGSWDIGADEIVSGTTNRLPPKVQQVYQRQIHLAHLQ